MNDHDTHHEHQTALTRADMTKPAALQTFRERGAVGTVDIPTGSNHGGARFENMLQMMEFAKMMSLADVAVPKFLRGNPGACLRIVMQADEWGFSPFAVADQAYVVGDRIAYMSAIIHAVVERRAPLESRLRPSWSGEGPTRRCKVTGVMIGERDPFVWEGPMFKDIKIKNSPEWANNPDKQLWFHASRDWARIFVPDVLLGVYGREELDGDIQRGSQGGNTGTIADRLPKQQIEGPKEGFDEEGIARTLSGAQGEPQGTVAPDAPETETPPSEARKLRKPASEKVPEEPEPEDPDAPLPEPTNNAEYEAYALDWIKRPPITTLSDAEVRWEDERDLRAKCRVSIATRKSIEKFMKAKLGKGA